MIFYPKKRRNIGPKVVFMPEALPKVIYDYYVHGLVDMIYINGETLKELQEFPLKVQGIIKGYKEIFAKGRELFLKIRSSYPIFDMEQKLLVPSITDKDEKIECAPPTIEDLYRENLANHFKKFVLGPVRLDRRYTNTSSLYVRIYPDDYVTKMSRLVAELQSQGCFSAKTEAKYSTDRVYALNLLKLFLETYWNVIKDRAKDALKKCVVDIFIQEEVARLQVYEAAYALMERISLIDNAEMWIPLEDMLRDAVRQECSEVIEQYKIMMNYYNVEWRWDLSLTLSPTTGPDYAMGKCYACGLIQHLNRERPSFFGVIEEVLLNKVEDWITCSSYRDQFVAVETLGGNQSFESQKQVGWGQLPKGSNGTNRFRLSQLERQ
nr:enzymatic polyprotein [Tanacetum cinerariifolium]